MRAFFAGRSGKWPLLMVLCTVASGACHAIQLELDNPDWRASWTNTLSLTLGTRLAHRNEAIARNFNNDEGNFKFDKGDLITSRVDWLSELDVSYQKNMGFRISTAAWADPTYNDRVKQNPALASLSSSYVGKQYADVTKRYYMGPAGEFRDAFVYGSFDLGAVAANVRLGRHTVYWGEALFTQGHGIAAGQGPLDSRRSAITPGAQAKDLFLPLNQLSAQFQLSDTVSLATQYLLEWDPSRISDGGTYFGTQDAVVAGPELLVFSGNAAVPPAKHVADLRPKNRGDVGLNLRVQPEGFDGNFGFYYRRYDEKFPWKPQLVNLVPAFGTFIPTGYRFAYASNVELFGVSGSTRLGDASVAVELSLRKNTALIGGVQRTFLSGTPASDGQGPRGDVLNLVVNSVSALPNSPLWDTGLFLIEGVYSRVQRVTLHPELFDGEGYGVGSTGCTVANSNIGGTSRQFGCATKSAVGMAMSFTPQWLSVWPSVNLAMPVSYSVGLRGNSAVPAGFNEKAYSFSIGLEADLYQKATVRLSYINQSAKTNPTVNGAVTSGNGNWQLNDRGWVALTARFSF